MEEQQQQDLVLFTVDGDPVNMTKEQVIEQNQFLRIRCHSVMRKNLQLERENCETRHELVAHEKRARSHDRRLKMMRKLAREKRGLSIRHKQLLGAYKDVWAGTSKVKNKNLQLQGKLRESEEEKRSLKRQLDKALRPSRVGPLELIWNQEFVDPQDYWNQPQPLMVNENEHEEDNASDCIEDSSDAQDENEYEDNASGRIDSASD